jgi:integrase
MVKVKKSINGTYEFRASLGFDPVTGKRIQKRKSGFKTIAEAKKAYAELLLNVEEEEEQQANSTNVDSMNFKEFTETIFIPWYKNKVKESTYINRKNSIDKHFACFYDFSLVEITPLILQEWQIKMSEKCSSQYVRSIQGLLSIAFDRAIVLGLMKENPSKIIGNVKKEKSKIDFWTKEEFEKVISQIYVEDYFQHFQFVCIWLLFMTGMRVGEATAIQWSDIDLDKRTLSVSKTLFYQNVDNYKFTEPKTRASNRLLALDEDTVTILQKWQKVQAESCQTEFVLSYNGVPTQKFTISYAINRYAKAAGVHRIRIHGLRHSHASLLISMNQNPLVIKDRLGHEDIQTTLGTYGHLYPNSNFEVADSLSGFVKMKTSDVSQIEHYSSNQFMKTEYGLEKGKTK